MTNATLESLQAVLTNSSVLFPVVRRSGFQELRAGMSSDRSQLISHTRQGDHTLLHRCVRKPRGMFLARQNVHLCGTIIPEQRSCESATWAQNGIRRNPAAAPRGPHRTGSKYFPSAEQTQWAGTAPNFNRVPREWSTCGGPFKWKSLS